MKKNVLTLAVAGAVSASAHAQMYVNPENTGEVLIYPFYTADAGNETYIHVVNTTNLAKAVKVRIIEAENSWEVRDFNLYLSEYDHFAFAIQLDESGGGKLVTGDTSCTVPAIPEDGIEFTNLLFEDEENGSVERTINGYVEVIEMGQFSEAAPTDTTAGGPGYYWTHVDGVPRSCDTVVGFWSTGGAWFEQVAQGGGTNVVGDAGALPTWQGGGLYGMGIIVNPEDGAAVGYDAVAIETFVEDDGSNDGGVLHYYPGDQDPALYGRPGVTEERSTVFVDGALEQFEAITSAFETLDAVSSLFMVDHVMNDYVLDPGFGGHTDWVITFPTKRIYAAEDGNTATSRAITPFTYEWDGDTSCDPYGITVYDREEDTPTPIVGQPPFSPYTADPEFDPQICYEANVLTFAKAGTDAESAMWGMDASASSQRIQTIVETPYDNGWADLSFDWDALNGSYPANAADDLKLDNDEGRAHQFPMFELGTTNEVILEGLPMVGFSVIRFGNDTLSGGTVLANYAAAHEHKTQRAGSAAGTAEGRR
jgi:hypothetical protein